MLNTVVFIILFFIGCFCILQVKNNICIKRSILVSVFLIIAAWLNGPNVTTIPDNVKLSPGPFSYNFFLFQKMGIVYTVSSTLILLAITWYIERPIEKLKMSADDTVKKYDGFIKDAKQLYVIGKDINFLQSSEIQKRKMKDLGKKCKILCTNLENDDMLDIYNELLDSKVDIRNYGDTDTETQICKLRGQLKETSSGVWEGLFVQQSKDSKGSEWEEIKLDNQFILGSLKKEFNKVHDNGTNPVIKCIALDLGGVYFDGDYNKDFVEKLNEKLNLSVVPNSKDTLVLNNDLNMGKIDIVEFWEQKTGKKFTGPEKSFIRDIWSSVWKPNKQIKRIMIDLAEKGYKVVPFSNLDKENGEMYICRRDFEKFKSNYYFSYKHRMLKPNKRFFDLLMKEEGCKPYEILLIDDKGENISQAKDLGWNTIHFNIIDGEEYLLKELHDLNLQMSEEYKNINTDRKLAYF